jgi:DNA mismatch endonuclease, patch repair protein
MVDSLSTGRRSWNMSRIRSVDTKPELIVKTFLFNSGFRYSYKNRKLPGRPDIVLPRYKVVIFIHGCYWHRHRGCKNATLPTTRKEWWEKKFASNVIRDRRNRKELIKKGWKVYIIWECEVKIQTISKLKELIFNIDRTKSQNLSLIDINRLFLLAEKKHQLMLNSTT